MRKTEVYQKALTVWGFAAQVGMLMEECGELIVTSNHFLRYGANKIPNMVEEIADVEIMIEQIKIGLGLHAHVEAEKEKKIIRLNERLNNFVSESVPPDFYSSVGLKKIKEASPFQHMGIDEAEEISPKDAKELEKLCKKKGAWIMGKTKTKKKGKKKGGMKAGY